MTISLGTTIIAFLTSWLITVVSLGTFVASFVLTTAIVLFFVASDFGRAECFHGKAVDFTRIYVVGLIVLLICFAHKFGIIDYLGGYYYIGAMGIFISVAVAGVWLLLGFSGQGNIDMIEEIVKISQFWYGYSKIPLTDTRMRWRELEDRRRGGEAIGQLEVLASTIAVFAVSSSTWLMFMLIPLSFAAAIAGGIFFAVIATQNFFANV